MQLFLDTLAGSIIDQDIILLELLGEGGMGVAYRARQKSLGRDLCIKFMRSELLRDSQSFERFKREAAALSQLNSAQIVKIYFIGVYKGYPYMAMELLDGMSLRSFMKKDVGWKRICLLFKLICEAMTEVHAAGFVHRDLKPDNVFIAEDADGDRVKILDFGLCSGQELLKLTQTNEVLGSVHYMAPECFQQSQNSPLVDIYAIGCMLYEVLCGAPLFMDDSPIGICGS